MGFQYALKEGEAYPANSGSLRIEYLLLLRQNVLRVTPKTCITYYAVLRQNV